jgi:hypothetical protein
LHFRIARKPLLRRAQWAHIAFRQKKIQSKLVQNSPAVLDQFFIEFSQEIAKWGEIDLVNPGRHRNSEMRTASE